MTPTTFHDLELISAYLDGQLSKVESARLEERLKTDEGYRQLLDELSGSRRVLRSLPARRAPRNFTLTPKMAGLKPPVPRAFPVFRLASVFATVLFFLVFAANISGPAMAAIRASAPPIAFGMGGGGGGDGSEPPAANLAPMAAAPAPEATSAASENQAATPEAAPLLQAAPTPTDGIPFAEAGLPTEMPAAPGATAKIAPGAQPAQDQYTPTERIPLQLPVPAWLQFGLLGLAVISAATAYVLRSRSETNWFKTRALQPAGPDRRQLLVIVLIALAALALAVSVWWVSTTTFYAAAQQVPVFADKSMRMTEQAAQPDVSGPVVTGADKGAPPYSGPQSMTMQPGMGYVMNWLDPSGFMTTFEFPANAFPLETTFTVTPGLDVESPSTGMVFTARAFKLSAEPAGGDPQVPFTISMDYGDQLLVNVEGDASRLVLVWWSGSEWVDAGSTCSPASETIRTSEPKRLQFTACKLGNFVLYAP